MAKICYEIQEWIEEEIEQPVEEWVEKTEEKCKKRPWWHPLRWFCWLVTTLVKVVVWVVVTIGKWITRVVCEIISFVITVIKIVIWTFVSVVDFIGSILGIQLEKLMRIKVFILTSEKTKKPVKSFDDVQKWVDFTVETYKNEMNVSIRSADLRGSNEIIEVIKDPVPDNVLNIDAGFTGFFSDETNFLSTLKDYTHTSAWDYILDGLGYGEPIYLFVVESINGGDNSGFAYLLGNTVLLSQSANERSMAHEIGHMCLLPHHSDEKNIMYKKKNDIKNKFTRIQSSWARSSRFITFLND